MVFSGLWNSSEKVIIIMIITRIKITVKIMGGAKEDDLDFLVFFRRFVLGLSFLVMSLSYHIMRVMIR